MLGLAVVVAIGLQRKAIQSSTGFQRFKHVKRVGAVKFQILFYTAQVLPCQNSTVFEHLRLPSISCQVLSEFARISASTGKGGEYDKPASTFAGVLSVSNLDVLGFGEFEW